MSLSSAIKILLMDDEALIRDVASQILDVFGYKVDCACHGDEAFSMYSQEMNGDSPYDLVILDISVPVGKGAREIMPELLELNPEIRVMISSGHMDDPLVTHFEKYKFCGILKKPYEIEEMEDAILKALG